MHYNFSFEKNTVDIYYTDAKDNDIFIGTVIGDINVVKYIDKLRKMK